jgi:hypothetical protein
VQDLSIYTGGAAAWRRATTVRKAEAKRIYGGRWWRQRICIDDGSSMARVVVAHGAVLASEQILGAPYSIFSRIFVSLITEVHFSQERKF